LISRISGQIFFYFLEPTKAVMPITKKDNVSFWIGLYKKGRGIVRMVTKAELLLATIMKKVPLRK
jgi:hypothetical protein